MKKHIVAAFIGVLLLVMILAGCARTWQFNPIDSYRPSEDVPPSSICQSCHQQEYDSWKKTRHASEVHMAIVPVRELRECGACHENVAAHAADANVKPGTSPAKLTKTEQNQLCGKCHYNQDMFGRAAINPNDKHALFMSVGLEGKKRQIACLDCHSGHRGKSEMLVSIKAHICFTCHKEAIHLSAPELHHVWKDVPGMPCRARRVLRRSGSPYGSWRMCRLPLCGYGSR